MGIKTTLLIILSALMLNLHVNFRHQSSIATNVIVIHDTVYVEAKQNAAKKATKPKTAKKTASKSNYKYAVSSKGIDFIKKMEDCKLTAYWDSDNYSIGYGHHGSDVKKGMTITQDQAEKYLKQDMVWVNDAINRILNDFNYKFSQDFVDGLGSLIYNCGEGGIRRSEFYTRLTKCRFEGNTINMSDYEFTLAAVKHTRISCDAHKTRRKLEYNLMKNGSI